MQARINAPEALIAKMVQGQSVAPLANERLNQTRNSPPAAPPRKIAHSSCLCMFGRALAGIAAVPLAWLRFRERSHQPCKAGGSEGVPPTRAPSGTSQDTAWSSAHDRFD